MVASLLHYQDMTSGSLAAGDSMVSPADRANGGFISGWRFRRIGQ